jgi:hypothetical protein
MLSLFLRTALETIDRYVAMSQRRAFVVHTRSYFHMMFTAGLSAMYCIAASVSTSGQGAGQDEAAPPTDLGLGRDVVEIARGLGVCEEALVAMSEQLPGAPTYVAVFGALRRHIIRQLQLAVPNAHGLLDEADHGPDQEARRPPNAALPASSISVASDFQPRGQEGSHQLPAYAGALQYDWMHDHAQPAGLNFQQFNPAMAGLGSVNQLPQLSQDELLQWTLTNDESIWDMDVMLRGYVYGDPRHGDLLNRVDF